MIHRSILILQSNPDFGNILGSTLLLPKSGFVAKIGVFSFEPLQYQTVSKDAKITKIFKILFLPSKTIEISSVSLYFHVYVMICEKQRQKINKTLIFHQFFCEIWKKMLLNSGFHPINVAKNPDFYAVKKPKKNAMHS